VGRRSCSLHRVSDAVDYKITRSLQLRPDAPSDSPDEGPAGPVIGHHEGVEGDRFVLAAGDDVTSPFPVGTATHVGLVRSANEDCLCAAPRLYVVADGMGGHVAGALASRIAIETFAALDTGALTPEDLHAATLRSHQAVLAHAAAHPDRAGMGTTLAGLAFLAGATPHWAAFNVGDSRVYAFCEGRLRQLTTDHSEVEELVAAGHLTAAEARTHPSRHVITQAIGGPVTPRADVLLFPAGSGGRYVVCSDGLTSEVRDDDIAATLAAHHSAQPTAEALVRLALAAGGRDNVSVIVIDEPPSGTPQAVPGSTNPRNPR
jgi:serine/threonine protein phosphatase PrpC